VRQRDAVPLGAIGAPRGDLHDVERLCGVSPWHTDVQRIWWLMWSRTRSRFGRIGSHPAAVWAIKHLVSPVDRFVAKVSGGGLPPPSSMAVPTLLLTTVGRHTGQKRVTPLVYVRDGSITSWATPAPVESARSRGFSTCVRPAEGESGYGDGPSG
jgi:hypothetical protein